MTRISIDPVTRIEGHLRIDAEVDGGGVRQAWASCTMWRGIELILRGRDPREAWLFAQRFCGVCTTVHAMASVRAVEDALGLDVPLNAQLIRNLILVAHALHDHIVHFYHLSALDWADVTAIPHADPVKAAAVAASLSDWPRNSPQEMRKVQGQVVRLLESGELGIFANGYWGHPAMALPPEVDLLAFAHYLQALEFQRKATQVVAILGGKSPHIQNLAVGGVMNAINFGSLATLNLDRLYLIKSLFEEIASFVHQVYFPDACAIAGLYPGWFGIGAGVRSYLAAPELPTDGKATAFDLPGGRILDGNLAGVTPLAGPRDQTFRREVAEDVTHAWYKGRGGTHPWRGETDPHYTDFREKGKYTWVKAPRLAGHPMEVGPLAGVLVGYATRHEPTRRWTDDALARVSRLARQPVGPTRLQSTMGRCLARAIRCALLAERALPLWERLVDNIGTGDTESYVPPAFPKGGIEGVGLHEAPRGILSHWVVIEDGRLSNYQAVVPTTWNASPRDDLERPGPYEASLVGTPVADPERPLELLRTVHSFDPCMACACHTLDPAGRPIATTRIP